MSEPLRPKITKKRTLAGLGAILASFAASGLLAACGVEKPEGGKPPAIVLDEVTLRHYAADGTVRVGQADEVIYDRKGGRLDAHSLSVDTPPTPGMKRGGAHLEAARGSADLKGKGASLEGGLTLRTGVGDFGSTEAATWDGTTETFEGDEPLEVQGPGYRASADGFRFQVPGQRLDLKGNVKIHTEPDTARAAAEVAE